MYADAEIEQLVTLYLGGADRDQLDEDGQVGFKAKAFGRAYGFLALILPYTSAEWEKSSIFLNFLVPISLRPWKRIFPKASLSPSTWTATGSRRSRRSESDARLGPIRPGFPFWPWHGESIPPRCPEYHVFSR